MIDIVGDPLKRCRGAGGNEAKNGGTQQGRQNTPRALQGDAGIWALCLPEAQ